MTEAHLVLDHLEKRFGAGPPAVASLSLDVAKGELLGLLEGATVTARRTAALSLLAARELAPRPEGPLLVVGTGAQGRAHLEAFREGLGVSKVFIASRTRENARALADHAEDLGMRATVVGNPGDALDESSLVVTATTVSSMRVCRPKVSP